MTKCCILRKSKESCLCKIASAIVAVLLLFFANTALLYAADIITGGIATQGSTYNNSSSFTADKVIDNDLNTLNHTLNGSDNNWWQVKLTAKHQQEWTIATDVAMSGSVQCFSPNAQPLHTINAAASKAIANQKNNMGWQKPIQSPCRVRMSSVTGIWSVPILLALNN